MHTIELHETIQNKKLDNPMNKWGPNKQTILFPFIWLTEFHMSKWTSLSCLTFIIHLVHPGPKSKSKSCLSKHNMCHRESYSCSFPAICELLRSTYFFYSRCITTTGRRIFLLVTGKIRVFVINIKPLHFLKLNFLVYYLLTRKIRVFHIH